jgi:hypothetical protein
MQDIQVYNCNGHTKVGTEFSNIVLIRWISMSRDSSVSVVNRLQDNRPKNQSLINRSPPSLLQNKVWATCATCARKLDVSRSCKQERWRCALTGRSVHKQTGVAFPVSGSCGKVGSQKWPTFLSYPHHRQRVVVGSLWPATRILLWRFVTKLQHYCWRMSIILVIV